MKSRRCAKAGLVLGRAGRHANLDESWDLKPWRTDIIRFPSTAEKALEEAMDADLMVLAGLRVLVNLHAQQESTNHRKPH